MLKPVCFTVMYKVNGFNPEMGDWFFAKYSNDGKVLAQGKVGECMRCHKSAWRNDFVKKNARTYRVQ